MAKQLKARPAAAAQTVTPEQLEEWVENSVPVEKGQVMVSIPPELAKPGESRHVRDFPETIRSAVRQRLLVPVAA